MTKTDRFRGDNVGCIEALIQASNHETNDDDLDGRTPLLLACLNGHSQAVQVLLSLGSDVSRRSESHIAHIQSLIYFFEYSTLDIVDEQA